MNISQQTVAIIIARLTSSRLPQKQLRLIAGKPMIYHVITRLKKVAGLDKIVLATASKKENQALADYVGQFDIPTYFDDDENDVTGRIARTANRLEAENVVTISGDCPLIEPTFLDDGIQLLSENMADYVFVDKKKYKCLHEGIGFFRNSFWQTLNRHSTTWFHKEHPGSVLSEMKEQFKGVEIIPETVFHRNDFRLSVDTISDLEFMNFVFEQCGQNGELVKLEDICALVDEKPFTKNINGHVHQKGLTEKSKEVTIVTHADETVGMGHLARCMALARELKESQAVKVTFYVNDDSDISQLLERQGFSANVWHSMEELSEKLSVEVQHVDGALIDLQSHYCDELLEKTGRLNTLSMLIDHVPTDASLADLFIVPTILFDPENESSYFARKKILTGKNHLLLNRKINWLRENNADREGILVSAGGSGILSDEIIEGLVHLSESEKIKILVGPFANVKQLHKKVNHFELKNCEVIFNPADALQVYNQAKFAFCVFGVTAYELLALGVPTAITATLYDADNAIVDELVTKQACLDAREIVASPGVFVSQIKAVLNDNDKLMQLSENGKNLIDGLGVKRVSRSIAELLAA